MPALSKLDGVEMTAFCDIEEGKARRAAAKYGTADAKVYTDYTELLQDPSIDIVHVLTPNDNAEITIAALEAGKHVMCEKPMAKKAADARRMLEAARKSGKKLTIGYQTRQSAESQYLKKVCKAGTSAKSISPAPMPCAAEPSRPGASFWMPKSRAAAR